MSKEDFVRRKNELMQEKYLPIAEAYRLYINPKMAIDDNTRGKDKYKLPIYIRELSGKCSYLILSEKLLAAPAVRFSHAGIYDVPTEDDPDFNNKCLDTIVYALAEFMYYLDEVIGLGDYFTFLSGPPDGDELNEPDKDDAALILLKYFGKTINTYTEPLSKKYISGGLDQIEVKSRLVYNPSMLMSMFPFYKYVNKGGEEYSAEVLGFDTSVSKELLVKELMDYYMLVWMAGNVFTKECFLKYLERESA